MARQAVGCFLTRGCLWVNWEEGFKVSLLVLTGVCKLCHIVKLYVLLHATLQYYCMQGWCFDWQFAWSMYMYVYQLECCLVISLPNLHYSATICNSNWH